MFLTRVGGRDESRSMGSGGGVYHHPRDASCTSPHGYACQRSYPPTAASPPPTQLCERTAVDTVTPSKPQASRPPRSPPQSPATPTSATGGKYSFGVFLQNCQVAGDFLQLRADGAPTHTPVRLYLTDTELVKKTSFSGSTTYAPDRDFTISRYPLQNVQVSASKVSSATLVVSVLGNAPSSSNGRVVGVADDLSCVTTTGFPSCSVIHADNGRTTHPQLRRDDFRQCNGKTVAEGSPSRRPVVVDAYRLQSDTQSTATEGVQHWISSVENRKRKLEMLERLRLTLTTTNATTATTIRTTATPESTSVPLSPLSPTRRSPAIPISVKTTTATSTSSSNSTPRRHPLDRGSEVLFRHSGYDYPSFGSPPTREKFPTTTNGRYTPLHHHYTPHPLFSHSHHHTNGNGSAVQLRQRRKPTAKEPFRLLRRLSLGAGTSGSYQFPPPPEHREHVRDESKSGRGRNGIGRTTYMFSLSQDPPSVIPPSISQSEIHSRNVGDASPQQQTTPTHKSGAVSRSWKQRRSIFSRSVSENCDLTSQHLLESDPSFSTVAPENTGNHISGEVSSATDDGIPFELRALQSLLTNLTSSHGSPSTPLPPSTHHNHQSPNTTHSSPHTPSDNEEGGDHHDNDEGFQSFLRHKQIRGRKIHVSPRANNSNSISSELLSPPLWMDRFSIPPPPISPPSTTTTTSTGSGTTGDGRIKASSLPRRHRVKTESTPTGAQTSKTLDREESSSPGPKSSSKTPKLFKRFHRHRRWQSSSGVKLEEEMIPPEEFLNIPLLDLKQQPLVGGAVVDRLYLLPAREVAEGLTQIDAELLGRISPDEIRDGAWMKRGQKEKMAPNILAMVQSFNQLALLVPTEVLGERTPQQRAKVISAYIQIANKCYYMKNFNSLKAVLAGLQSTPVYRLRRTWKDIPSKRKKQFKMLCRLMSEENNWQDYRDELDGCLATSTPCVPYLGQFLTQVCHQLSYDKMRAEKEEVQLRRRSRSFVGVADEKREGGGRVGDFRRRSNSFHRGSLEMSSMKETSTTSLSTPVSPVVSEDESESSKNSKGEEGGGGRHHVIAQVGKTGMDEDSQSLEFSIDLDDQELGLPMSQPEPTSIVSPDSPEGDKHHNKTLARKKRRPSQKLISNFHSTPVKDANGYIKPLCSPLKMTFDEEFPTTGLGYDEPDLDVLPRKYRNERRATSFDIEQSESSRGEEENTNSEFRIKIPSISLQKTSSHSSIDEDWEERHVKTVLPEARKISKSRSLELNLGLGLNGTGTERNETSDGELRLNRLTPSHSIPSLDSDSVFSIEDDQREGQREGEGEEEGERKVEEKEKEKEGGGNAAKGFVRRKLKYQLEASFETSLDSEISTEDVETYRLAHTITSTTSNATPSTATQDISREGDTIFSPVSSSSDFYAHSRDQSFSTVESSSVAYDTRDTSSSPVETSNAEQSPRKRGEVAAASPKQEGRRVDRKKARKHAVHRSKSVTGPGTYRHKWRWKKAIALNNTSHSTASASSTLNNADPFHLLQIYKERSSDCLTGNATPTNTRTDFRIALNRFNSNSETRNYELSFEREP